MADGDSTMHRPVVKVGATVKAFVEPESAIFEIRFGRRCKTLDACAGDFAAEQLRVKAALERFGLSEALKVHGYSSYAHRTGKKGVIDGYEYGCWGVLEVGRSEHDAGMIWQALSESGASASVNLRFKLDDGRAAEDSLIEKAVARAWGNAEALARSAGMLLGGVREIKYRRKDCGAGLMLGAASMRCSETYGDKMPSFDPEPIEIECHVDVDWWLDEP